MVYDEGEDKPPDDAVVGRKSRKASYFFSVGWLSLMSKASVSGYVLLEQSKLWYLQKFWLHWPLTCPFCQFRVSGIFDHYSQLCQSTVYSWYKVKFVPQNQACLFTLLINCSWLMVTIVLADGDHRSWLVWRSSYIVLGCIIQILSSKIWFIFASSVNSSLHGFQDGHGGCVRACWVHVRTIGSFSAEAEWSCKDCRWL